MEGLHPELPGPDDTIVDFPEAVIGAAKVSHFEITCRVQNLVPTLALFRVFYVPSYNSGWMSFSKRPRKNTPQCYTKPLDSLKNWNNRFFWVDEIVFPTVVDWRTSAPKDEMPTADSYRAANVAMLNTRRTPIQKQPKALLCLMDVFNLISVPNPSKVKIGIRPRAAHEVPLLTVTANWVIEMKDPSAASGSSGTPSTVERSPLDFDNENPAPAVTEGTGAEEQAQDGLPYEEPPKETPATTGIAQEAVLEKGVVAVKPLVNKRRKQLRRKRANEDVEVNAPPKVLRRDHAPGPAHSTAGGKSLASMGLEAGIPIPTPTPQETPANVSDPDPLSYAKPSSKGTVAAGDPNSEKSTSFTSLTGSPSVPPGYFSELRHLPNEDFLSQYNINLAQQVALGSQLRLRFEQENRLLKRATKKVTKRDQRILAREEEVRKIEQEVQSLRAVDTEVQGLRNQTKNLETLLEAEVDMKMAMEAKNAELGKELESLHVKLAELQLNNHQSSQQVSTL
ncbi:hypothetical protein Tco_1022830 [Tanacetum coccineum]